MESAQNSVWHRVSAMYLSYHNQTSNNHYYSFSYPYQLEAFLNSNLDELIEIAGYTFIILDHGLGGYDMNSLVESRDMALKSLEEKGVKHVRIELGLPHINGGEYDIQKDYSAFLSGINGLYIRNIDDLATVREMIRQEDNSNQEFSKIDILLSSSIYLYNDLAIAEVSDILSDHKGMVLYEKSLELSERELKVMHYNNESFSLYYGKLPLMVTSGLRDTEGILTDDRGHRVRVIKCNDLCYNTVLGGLPQSLHGLTPGGLYSFTDESGDEVRDVLSQSPKYIEQKLFTRGHFEKGI